MNPFATHPRPGFLERNLAGMADILEHAAYADTTARQDGVLQRLDPRAKIIGLGLWIIVAVCARSVGLVLAMGISGALLALVSRIPLHQLAGRVWLGVLVFTGVIALPAVFLTPGAVAGTVPMLGWPVTTTGIHTAALLLARAETTATLALTLLFSTPWTRVLKALRVLGVPVVLVVILGMTHRYIFLLLRMAQDYFTARRSRLVGPLDGAQSRRIVAGTAGVLLGKSMALSEEVYQAMQSRGFRGEVYTLDDFRWRWNDSRALFCFAAVAFLALSCELLQKQ